MVEVVSEPSVLAGTAAAHFQDYLSSRRSFARHCTQIYSPSELFCLDEKFTSNKSYQGKLKKRRVQTPNGNT